MGRRKVTAETKVTPADYSNRRTGNRTELAAELGVHPSRVDQARMDGRISHLPGTKLFDLDESRANYYRKMDPSHAHKSKGLAAALASSPAAAAEGVVDMAEARRRQAVAKAALVELELARARRDLLPADEVRRAWYEALRILRNNVLALPALLGDALAAETDGAKVRALLTSEITRALETSADGLGGER